MSLEGAKFDGSITDYPYFPLQCGGVKDALFETLMSDDVSSKKLLYLRKLQEEGVNIPPFFSISQLSEEFSIESGLELIGNPEKVIVRSAYKGEGEEQLPWTDIFCSIQGVNGTQESVLSAYKYLSGQADFDEEKLSYYKLLSQKGRLFAETAVFKGKRYALLHGLKDISCDDIDAIIMPEIQYDNLYMIKPVSINHAKNFVPGLKVLKKDSGGGERDLLIVKDSDKEKLSSYSLLDLELESQLQELYQKCEGTFGFEQELEVLEKDGKLFLVQSRDYVRPREEYEYINPLSMDLPDMSMPVVIIDEREGDLEGNWKRGMELGLSSKEYLIVFVSLEDKMNGGNYAELIQESTVAFVPNASHMTAHERFADHAVGAERVIERMDNPELVLQKIEHLKDSKGHVNPKQLHEELSQAGVC